ncbi:expressed unknown protein [Seminavis robusta]|uniref:Uncharacterized protein n=1 Tax=Seminavis robusta TaxID=568900 RepID=A0A9N8DSZ2_9STRA|nr:expressed unknown protein [Seminavis robusta]|eukprot:Sro333_g119670.1 n/a (1862) ;mRNA; f:67300-72885
MAASSTSVTRAGAVEDTSIGQRLRFVKFPRDYEVAINKSLYWPALFYSSHKEANSLSANEDFVESMMLPILEMRENGSDDDPGPVCRLLGFPDGGYYGLGDMDVEDKDNDVVISFSRNVNTCFVHESKKEDYFDKAVECEQELFECYQAAFAEAKTILAQVQLKKKRRFTSSKRRNLFKKARLDNNNGGGGGGSNNDDNDKPDSAAKVTFQESAPATNSVTAIAQPPLAHQPPAASATQETQQAVTNEPQETATEDAPEETSNKATASQEEEMLQEVSTEETATEESTEQEVVAVAAVPVTAGSPARVKTTETMTPPTPPFANKNLQKEVKPHTPWSEIWKKCRYVGWLKRVVDGQDRWLKPGRSVNGEEGVDFFTSEAAVQAYIQSKIPHWRPPAWIEGGNAQPSARRSANNNNQGMSSSGTVVTTDSGCSKPAPAEQHQPNARPNRRAKEHKYNDRALLGASGGKEHLWWRKFPVPTLAQVKPILFKLGIRRSEGGKFQLPEAVAGIRDSLSCWELANSETLRKFLCTKGVPYVGGHDILEKQEQELLHRWVSFAYVPIDDLPGSLKSITLPTENKLQLLLSKFHFEKCGDHFYPPNNNLAGVTFEDRVEGVHIFNGSPRIRDYIRRTASFPWTKDEFEISDLEVKGYPEEKALLRLWAASSPSPLKTFETSLAEISHMERILPQAGNDFESDDEEGSIEASDVAQNDDDSEDDSIRAASASEEEKSSPDASTSDRSDSDATSSSDVSGSSGSEDDASSGSESDHSDSSQHSIQSYETPVRKSEKATGKRKATGKGSRRKKAKSGPWWRELAPPTWNEIRPLLGKLGIYQDAESNFIMPAQEKREVKSARKSRAIDSDESNMTEETPILPNQESLRQRLCTHGVPILSPADARKPEKALTPMEKEKVRRWAYSVFFPTSDYSFADAVQQALPTFQKSFVGRGIEHAAQNLLRQAGFSRDGFGSGYFPHGIDALGREREIRRQYLLKDLPAVRKYIRESRKLSLDDWTEDKEIESKMGTHAFLALRLWGSGDDAPLIEYKAKCELSVGDDMFELAPEEVAPVRRQKPSSVASKKQKKGTGAASVRQQKPSPPASRKQKKDASSRRGQPVSFPVWWHQPTDQKLREIIELDHRRRESKRYTPPAMTAEHIEIALMVRRQIVTEIQCSQDDTTIDNFVQTIYESLGERDDEVKPFLKGNVTLILHRNAADRIADKLTEWLANRGSPSRNETHFRSKGRPSGKATKLSRVPVIEESDKEEEVPDKSPVVFNSKSRDNTEESRGSCVMDVGEATPGAVAAVAPEALPCIEEDPSGFSHRNLGSALSDAAGSVEEASAPDADKAEAFTSSSEDKEPATLVDQKVNEDEAEKPLSHPTEEGQNDAFEPFLTQDVPESAKTSDAGNVEPDDDDSTAAQTLLALKPKENASLEAAQQHEDEAFNDTNDSPQLPAKEVAVNSEPSASTTSTEEEDGVLTQKGNPETLSETTEVTANSTEEDGVLAKSNPKPLSETAEVTANSETTPATTEEQVAGVLIAGVLSQTHSKSKPLGETSQAAANLVDTPATVEEQVAGVLSQTNSKSKPSSETSQAAANLVDTPATVEEQVADVATKPNELTTEEETEVVDEGLNQPKKSTEVAVETQETGTPISEIETLPEVAEVDNVQPTATADEPAKEKGTPINATETLPEVDESDKTSDDNVQPTATADEPAKEKEGTPMNATETLPEVDDSNKASDDNVEPTDTADEPATTTGVDDPPKTKKFSPGRKIMEDGDRGLSGFVSVMDKKEQDKKEQVESLTTVDAEEKTECFMTDAIDIGHEEDSDDVHAAFKSHSLVPVTQQENTSDGEDEYETAEEFQPWTQEAREQ